jgi:hypothetical protein
MGAADFFMLYPPHMDKRQGCVLSRMHQLQVECPSELLANDAQHPVSARLALA